MKRSIKKNLYSLICAMFITSAALAADNIFIPEMGTAGARGMTVQTERLYGEYFMRKARGAGIISYDPVMTEFINSVGQKLVLNANINGVGYVMTNMRLTILQKVNAKDFNFLSRKMIMKLN